MRAVVVGTSHGGRVQVPALRAAGFEVAALVGRDAGRTARRAERLGVARPCTSLTEALGDGGIDLVAIATPPATHCGLTLDALAAGAHVLCEKPLALDPGEAASMVSAARQAGRVAVVGNEFRFRDARAAVQVALDAGRIGRPMLLQLIDSTSLLIGQTAGLAPWYLARALGGGWLGSSGSHAIDQAMAWLGPIEAVSAGFGRWPGRPGDSEDLFTLRVAFTGGADGVIQESGASYGPRVRLERIAGEQGTVAIEGESAVLYDASGSAPLAPPADLAFADLREDGHLDDPAEEFAHLRPFARLARRLYEAIEHHDAPSGAGGGAPASGRRRTEAAPRLATFEDGARVLAVMAAAVESDRSGGRLVEVAPVA